MRALLIDLYDTLVWTDWTALGGLMAARLGVATDALANGYVLTRAARSVGQHGSVRGNLAAIAAASGSTAGAAEIAELACDVVRLLEDNVHLYDDALPALRAARAAGLRTALVSNCDHATRPVVTRLALEAELDAVVLSFEVGSAKPDAGIFHAALALIGAEARDALFVDDQSAYLDGARALGMRTLRIARPPHSDLPESSAHPVILDLSQLT